MIVVNREKKIEYEVKYKKILIWFYKNSFGRLVLKILATRTFAKIVGAFMNTRLSCFLKGLITKQDDFDIHKFEDIKYNCYNKIFTRKYKDEYLNINNDSNTLISPCESKLFVKKIDSDSTFKIKNSIYHLKDLINNDIVNDYLDGYVLIFRLEVTDYHRYIFIDNGHLDSYNYIDGILHTVQPIVYDYEKVFHRNSREWTLLHTDSFGDVIQIEVGALLIGHIVNDKNKKTFHRGEEKGYFEFGGSTIILLMKKDSVQIDEDILINSSLGKETIVKCGEKIGIKVNNG